MVRSIRHFEIPSASLLSVAVRVFNIIALLIYDWVFVPFARKYTGHPSGITVLQRIGFGLFLSYFVFGVSDAFAVAGLQQLFYDEVAETMRSLGAAAYISLQGFGTLAISNVVISVVEDVSSRAGEKWLAGSNLNRAHLDSFYWVLAALCAVNLCIYLLAAKYFVYKQVHVVVDPSVNTTDDPN
ncbi:hypothetical protein K1719_013624 [Acacia pycnantha]|nr:hypothetical protein K1719_013624 [Acacia pycnantha]